MSLTNIILAVCGIIVLFMLESGIELSYKDPIYLKLINPWRGLYLVMFIISSTLFIDSHRKDAKKEGYKEAVQKYEKYKSRTKKI